MKTLVRAASVLFPILALSSFLISDRQTVARDEPHRPPNPLKTKVDKDQVVAHLQTLIPQLMSDGDVPGLSIALIRDSAVVWQHGFGVKNAATREPVGDDTIFEAASLSKPMVAYAALKMADKGQLDLDAPLSKYLPDYIKDDSRLNLITTRRVLSHTTGFPNWRPVGQSLKIHFTPGERFSYSGEGFVYLQRVIEKIAGQPLDEFMQKTVLEPLGMTASSYVWQERYESLKATAHDAAGNPTQKRKPALATAAASLHTTAGDYAKFVLAIMNGTGLKKETGKEMLRPQISVEVGCKDCTGFRTGKLAKDLSWGLGLGLQQTEEGISFWHWGDNNGDVHCYVVSFPVQKIGAIIFTNSGNGHSIIPEIIAEAIGGKHPAFAWLGYESYNSPTKKLYRDLVSRGGVALDEYREKKKALPEFPALIEAQVNRLGYWLLSKKKIKEAIQVFKMNVEDYPDSSNAYDSLGEAYMIDGDKELAIASYQKSIELNPNNTHGAQILKKLRGQ